MTRERDSTAMETDVLSAIERIMPWHSILESDHSPKPPDVSGPMKKHLSCPICMDLFVEPVTTACGHSFCLRCLNCNALYNDKTCPLCKQYLSRIPQVNIVLKGLLQDLDQQARSQRAQEFTGRPGEVACDVCPGPGARRALKSCLMCLASYCQAHLEGHARTGRLRGHRLVEPLENLEDRACPEHGRPMELYCRDSGRCVCALCVHEGQEVVSMKTEWEAKKGKLNCNKKDLQQRIVKRKHKLKEIRSSLKVFQDHLRKECLDIDGALSAVVSLVEEARRRALAPADQKSQAVERQAKEVTEQLQDQIRKLGKSVSDLERISDLDDHFDFLQTYPSAQDLEKDNDITDMALDVSVFFGTFRGILKNMLDDIHDKLELVTQIELQRIVKFAVDVRLDSSTAHPRLIVSADGKEVQDGGKTQEVPDGPQRFDLYASILGQNPLTSGKAYWQVAVGDKTGWDLGVASVDSQRKGKLVFEPATRYWVIVHYDDRDYAAMTAPPRPLALRAKPEMVGVFLDYQEGLVSFYDLTSSTHIFSFTACVFSGELRPYFSPHNEADGDKARPLVISAV